MLSDIAQRVVLGVGAKLAPEEQARIAASPTDNLDAYELYMIGRNRLAQFSMEKLREAIDHFEAAIREDSTFALAYSGLGEALTVLPMYDLTVETLDVMERARAAVTRAYELDPTAGEVHASLALFLKIQEWDWAGAERHYLEALRLNPGDVLTHIYYASLLSAVGRVGEGVEETRLVLAMDPQSSGAMWASGDRLWQAGRVNEARGLYEQATQMEPPVPWAFSNGALSYALDDPVDLARAVEMMSEFAALFGYPSPDRIAPLVEALGGNSALHAKATAVLDEIVDLTPLDPVDLFHLYAVVAPRDVFFEILEKAVQVRHIWVPWIPIATRTVNPALLDDPRWTEFLAKIGHPGVGPL